MKKVVTFGEIMLRLAPCGYSRFFQSDQMQATFGGAEANAAVSLARFGLDSVYVTRLPAHAIGQAAVDALRRYGVDTTQIVRGGERVGIYYVEKGVSQRAGVCIYDRAYSSIQTACASDFDWDAILKGADWFHFTGITPALGGNLAAVCRAACIAAKERGVSVSCDTNYRAKLWDTETAGAVMRELSQYVDVCFTNAGDAKDLFAVVAPTPDFDMAKPDRESCRAIARQLKTRFGFQTVALTMRACLTADEHHWSAMASDGDRDYFGAEYDLRIVDRIGGGDAFDAGFIYGMLARGDLQYAVDFAAAAAALKHTIEGDVNLATVDEVETLMRGGGSMRVQR